MKDFAAERRAGEHPTYERSEFHVAVIEFHGNWATELHLICLESGRGQSSFRALDANWGVPVLLGPTILAWLFRASYSANDGTYMLSPTARTYGPHPASVLCISLSEYFDADDKLARHVEALREQGGTASDKVGAFATRAFLDRVVLLMDALEVLAHTVCADMNIP